ncbi:MAG: EpsG family protein [Muribaculaceae bacterium]|nr:EpsG family protein [Muribaculaceae bacterium]
MALLYILLIVGFSGLIFQRSKLVTILIFVFTWTLMWNTKTPDFSAYKSIYTLNEFRDGGYSVLCSLGRYLGLSFYQFYLVLGAISYIIYCRFTIKYADRCSLVASLYLLFISYFDIVQFRNFVAFSIVLLAIPKLFSDKRSDIIKYCVTVVLASSIHVTMLFYLVFPFMNKDVFRLENIKQYLLPLLLLIVCMYFGVSMFEERVSNISENYDKGVSTATKLGIVMLLAGNIAYISYWTKKKPVIQLSYPQYVLSENTKQQVLFFNVAMVLLFPIAVKSLTIFRLYKYIGLINFAFVSNKFVAPGNLRIIPQTIIITLYGLTYLGLFFYIHWVQFIPYVMLPLLTRNLFWTFL